MPERREYTRCYSAEYLAATRREVTRVMMVHPRALGEFVDAQYVGWLEEQLTKARAGKEAR